MPKQKLNKQQFCDLMNRREDIKRMRKELQLRQETEDINEINRMRSERIYKKARIVI